MECKANAKIAGILFRKRCIAEMSLMVT